MEIALKQALSAWHQTVYTRPAHLPVKRLYEIGQAGGFKAASRIEQEHLSWCPHCLEYLLLFSKEDDFDTGFDKEDDQVMGYGFLKAAAAEGSEPVETQSSCGRFSLSIYPELENPDQGMGILAALQEADRYEGLLATVRDASGTLILRSRIVQGRAASKIDSLDPLELSEWTIILSPAGKS